MAHSLSNISDKNYQHRPMHVEVTVCSIGVVFFCDTVCIPDWRRTAEVVVDPACLSGRAGDDVGR